MNLAGNTILALVATFAVVLNLLAMAAVFWVVRPARARSPRLDRSHLPPVTIYKPLRGLDEGLEENLRGFFRLDYPRYQLLFGVADPNDPAIPVVRRLLAEFPDIDAELVVGNPPFGLNPKVENLAALQARRAHDVVLISDSNVRVRPEYLRETVCYLADPKVGLVTNLFAGVGETGAGGALENLQLNGFVAAGVALAGVTGRTCVVGKSMLMPARVLDEVGGFWAVRHILAEDQVLGVRVRRAGYSIALSHHVIDNVNHTRGLRWFLNRHSRWYKIRRRLALPYFLLEPFANLGAIGVVWALSDDTGLAWAGLAALVGLGVLRDALQTRVLRGSWPKLRHLPLSLVKDLFLLPVWFDALVNQRVHWRGHRMLVGRHTRLRALKFERERRRRRKDHRRLQRRRKRARNPET